MRINANIAALNAARNLGASTDALSKSLEKLSSGYRINRAADDAAGLSISEGLRAEISGSVQAQRNAQDGISFIQTTEGALTEVHSMLQRMRELAVQAANGGTGDNGAAEGAEVAQLLAEITGIGSRTTFSGNKVFTDYSASTANLVYQVGAHKGDTISAVTSDFSLNTSGTSGVFAAATIGGTAVSAANLASLDLSGTVSAALALKTIDDAIKLVSNARGTLGAVQNRLEHTVANLGVAVENLTASESRIRDVDMSSEMVKFTRAQILQQAGTSMLAQANTIPQSMLTLLR
jgi:flagellin